MKIAISGVHGTGKTTLINALIKEFDKPENLELKQKKYEFYTGITRSAKKLKFKINEDGDDKSQKYIMSQHLYNLYASKNFISDRCILDSFVYGLYLYDEGKISDKSVEELRNVYYENISKYDKVFYIAPEFDLVEDGTRSTNEDFRDKVLNRFKFFGENLKYNNYLYILSGSVEDRVNDVLDFLRNEE